ncbi:sensor histidine kinase [Amycolatopsis sp. CB00013]|uniref:sensor histidine kinase n=1 Tax=Amycolatopsis sp. CB00013 TaxID=1703945 RepID=UPI0009F8F3B4|nr:histidine kinase [Amycolatopsis sp. CB00013]
MTEAASEEAEERRWRWAAPAAGTALLAVTQMTATVPAGAGWLWVLYAVSSASWLLWIGISERFPRAALLPLAAASAVPAFGTGAATDGTAVIMTCITLAAFASRLEPDTVAIIALMVFDAAAIVASSLLGHRPSEAWLGALGAVVIVVLVGFTRRGHLTRVAQAERLLHQERLAHTRGVRAATLDERTRIAREIHDVVAHSLGALRVQLEVMHTLLVEEDDTEGALRSLALSRSLADQGLSDVRDAVAALREDVRALPDALNELVRTFGREHDTPAEFTMLGEHRDLPSAQTIALLRICREALTNAAKHAAGEAVSVELEYPPDEVRLHVRNPLAAAPDPGHTPGYGLTGMRERIELVDGTLVTGPDGRFWDVTARVPG